MLHRLLEITLKALGPDDLKTLKVRVNLAHVCTMRLEYAEAERLYRGVVQVLEKTVGGEHPELAGYLLEYAKLLKKLGRKQEAKPIDKRARSLRRED